ncbi:unnamed protein product [Caenorhabditis brenneri]
MKPTLITFVTLFLSLSAYADKCPRGYEEPEKQTACKSDKDHGTYNICLKKRCCEGNIADPERDYGLKCSKKCSKGKHPVKIEPFKKAKLLSIRIELCEFGMTTAAQIYFVVSIFAVVGVSVLGMFENRFYVLFAEHTLWKYARIPFFIMNYFLAFVFFIPPYLSIPDQAYALEQVTKKLSPNPPSWLTSHPVFVLATDFTYSLTSIFLITIFIIGEVCLFIFLIALNTKCMARKMHLSKATLRMQRKFLNAIHVQVFTK